MGAPMVMIERVLLCAVPVRERDCVLGDLNEEFGEGAGARRIWAMFRIIGHYQAEPYRRVDSGFPVLIVAALGLTMVWVIPIASGNMFVDPDLLQNPLMRMAATVWRASHITAALAVGLFVGHTSLITTPLTGVRWHIAAVLGVTLMVTSSGPASGAVGVAVLVGSIWVGDEARKVA